MIEIQNTTNNDHFLLLIFHATGMHSWANNSFITRRLDIKITESFAEQ